MNKEKQFTSYDSQGPTDIDVVGLHLDTTDDILQLIDLCYKLKRKSKDRLFHNLLTSEKLDELKHYTLKLQRYVENLENRGVHTA